MSLEPGSAVSARGRTWTVIDLTPFADCASVRLSGGGPARDPAPRTLLLPFDRVRPLARGPRLRAVRPRRWVREIARLAARAHPHGSLRTAAGSAIDLLPYQLEPALAVARGATRVMIADAVGLGKTIQAGLILREVEASVDQARAMVVAPAGLRDQWRAELRSRFALDATIADAAWLQRAAHDLPPGVNPWVLPGIYVTSFDFLKRPEVLQPVEAVTWDALVVDEAHNATAGTARRAATDAAARRARRVVLLTATPHGGDPAQFAALCALGAHDPPRDPILVFHRSRSEAGAETPRRTRLLAVRLSPAERRLHRLLDDYTARVWREAGARGDLGARLAAVVLRKRALSSAASLASSTTRRLALLGGLPPIPERQLPLPLGGEDVIEDDEPDRVLAAPGLADGAAERALLQSIVDAATRVPEIESKTRFLLRMLRRTREPAIVFTEFRDTLVRLHHALSAAGIACETLHGGQPAAERRRAQLAFNTGPARVLLATDAASEGLNLQARCRVVVHYELPWAPSRLEQRTGRVDRIGQRRVVHEVLLLASDTAERLVLAPLVRKAARARASLPSTSRLIDVLSESRVAGAVLDGDPGDPLRTQETGPPDQPPMRGAGDDLHVAGEHESRRLGLVRSWLRLAGSVPAGAGSDSIILSTLRRRAPAMKGPACVHRLTLVSPSGAIEHERIVVALDARITASGERTAASARRASAAWLDAHGAEARELILAAGREELRQAAAARRDAAASLARRERDIALTASSAARHLVQAGLFDRRALRARAAERRAAGALLDESDRRLESLGPDRELTTRIEVVAVLWPGTGR